MDSFFKNYYQKLKIQIKEIDEDNSEILLKLEKTILATISYVNTLKDHVKKNSFQSIKDEIDYFKNVLPYFVSEYIFYSLLRKHEIDKIGKCTPKALKSLCKSKLKLIEQYNSDHHAFIAYYQTKSSHLDEKFFIRHKEDTPLIFEEYLALIDNDIITGYDLIAAKYLAYNRFSEYLNMEIQNLSSGNPIPYIFPSKEFQSNFKWTSSKVNLVELLYALIALECINDGKCDVNQLADLFEKVFNIKLGNYYHIFTEIKERKNPTQFLDSLKEALLKKLNESDI